MQVAQTIFLTCSQCREKRCLSCVTFKSAVKTLVKTLDSDVRKYVQNFVVDFLQISDETLNNLFKIETKLSKSRTKPKTFDVKVYHKSEKNRSQVVMKTLDDCKKIQYISKRRKRTFYKKNWLFLLEIENKLVKKKYLVCSYLKKPRFIMRDQKKKEIRKKRNLKLAT